MYAIFDVRNTLFAGFSRYQNVSFGSQRDNYYIVYTEMPQIFSAAFFASKWMWRENRFDALIFLVKG